MNTTDALLRYTPVMVALACILWGWIWLGESDTKLPIKVGGRRVFLEGRIATLFKIGLILLGIFILGFVAANILWFDTGEQVETTLGGHPTLVSKTSLRIWNVSFSCSIAYLIVSGPIVALANRVREEDKQKEKRKPKRKNDWGV